MFTDFITFTKLDTNLCFLWNFFIIYLIKIQLLLIIYIYICIYFFILIIFNLETQVINSLISQNFIFTKFKLIYYYHNINLISINYYLKLFVKV